MSKPPLGLPTGSVRSILALSLVWALIAGADGAVADLAKIVVAFYFGTRSGRTE